MGTSTATSSSFDSMHITTPGTLAEPSSKDRPAIAPPTIAPAKKSRNISMPHTMHASVLEAT